jgi:bifunctional non-homologous end joining protein LigD
MPIQQISLYYKEGSSDKVYHIQLEEKNSGYVVNFQYGRRGSTLTAGTKTKNPIELLNAQKTFNTIVKEKLAKGYTEGESGAIFQSSTLEERVTGIFPQLLNNVRDDDELEKLFQNDDWFMEEKFDGRRLMTQKEVDVLSINKKGLSILIPEVTANIIQSVSKQILVDGEIIGENYHIFDILEYDNKNLRNLCALERYQILSSVQEIKKFVIPAYFTEKEKRKAFQQIKLRNGEGVVFKKKDSTYVSGRPASGGYHLKYKFWASATVKVIQQNKNKRSVTVAVYDGNQQRDMGNVTIPSNYDIPKVGDFVEIIYLYCHPGEEGKLYQSKYKGIRDDQDISDCNLSQIKFKSSSDEDDE